jgi:hypothetical protein
MTGVIVIMAVALFLAGVAIGVFAAVAVAVRREDRSYPLTGEAPSRLVKYARYLNGLVRPDLDGELFPPRGDPRRY